MPRVADWLEKMVQKGALEKVWEKEKKKKKKSRRAAASELPRNRST